MSAGGSFGHRRSERANRGSSSQVGRRPAGLAQYVPPRSDLQRRRHPVSAATVGRMATRPRPRPLHQTGASSNAREGVHTRETHGSSWWADRVGSRDTRANIVGRHCRQSQNDSRHHPTWTADMTYLPCISALTARGWSWIYTRDTRQILAFYARPSVRLTMHWCRLYLPIIVILCTWFCNVQSLVRTSSSSTVCLRATYLF